MFYHATPLRNLDSIRDAGLLVSKANPASKIQGVWVCTMQNRPWSVLHTIRKYHVSLDEVAVIEIHVLPGKLTRFRQGLYYSLVDIAPSKLGIVINGMAFGAGVSE